MLGMAAALSKDDIANLAAYYASLPSPLRSAK
jgi:cytochrome c553